MASSIIGNSGTGKVAGTLVVYVVDVTDSVAGDVRCDLIAVLDDCVLFMTTSSLAGVVRVSKILFVVEGTIVVVANAAVVGSTVVVVVVAIAVVVGSFAVVITIVVVAGSTVVTASSAMAVAAIVVAAGLAVACVVITVVVTGSVGAFVVVIVVVTGSAVILGTLVVTSSVLLVSVTAAVVCSVVLKPDDGTVFNEFRSCEDVVDGIEELSVSLFFLVVDGKLAVCGSCVVGFCSWLPFVRLLDVSVRDESVDMTADGFPELTFVVGGVFDVCVCVFKVDERLIVSVVGKREVWSFPTFLDSDVFVAAEAAAVSDA